jgi:hypothetical protein
MASNMDFLKKLKNALAENRELPPPDVTVREQVPGGAVKIGSLPPHLQHVFYMLEEVSKEVDEAEKKLAELRQVADDARNIQKAIKAIFYKGIEEHFVTDIPQGAGGIGIAGGWAVYYLTRESASQQMQHAMIDEIMGSMR